MLNIPAKATVTSKSRHNGVNKFTKADSNFHVAAHSVAFCIKLRFSKKATKI